jgi:plastocyanin
MAIGWTTSPQEPNQNQKGKQMETSLETVTNLNARENSAKIVSTTKRNLTKCVLLGACLTFAGVTQLLAQENPRDIASEHETVTTPVQIVALDECDPKTFNDALGPDFCHNVTLGKFTVLLDLFKKAKAGTPDPNWDFEPDTLTVKKGTPLVVTDQGGEPHTFTEVEHFGGGFIPDLNGPGEEAVPECDGGFANLGVARTRILQGSQQLITGLGKGEHLFQCCIHPWMRVKVEVK